MSAPPSSGPAAAAGGVGGPDSGDLIAASLAGTFATPTPRTIRKHQSASLDAVSAIAAALVRRVTSPDASESKFKDNCIIRASDNEDDASTPAKASAASAASATPATSAAGEVNTPASEATALSTSSYSIQRTDSDKGSDTDSSSGDGTTASRASPVSLLWRGATAATPPPTQPRAAYVPGPARPDLLREECLADVFEATAARLPHKTAATFGDGESLTYGELGARADALAHELVAAHGVRPGHIVGMWVPKCLDMLVVQLAIAKTGAAWIAMDFYAAPPDRVALCCEDAGAKCIVLLNRESGLDPLAAVAPATLPLVLAQELLAAPKPARLARRPPTTPATPSDPAYVIYTSGSTGKPKGIVISQGNICHLLRAESLVMVYTEDDVVYQGFSLAFDMSFEEIWLAYLAGSSLWMSPREMAADPIALPVELARHGVTSLVVVPTLLALFASDVPTLRQIQVGGEACPDSIVQRYGRVGVTLWNSYGPSETTVSATFCRLEYGKPVTIGHALANYDVCVVHPETLRVVDAGATGELLIAGPGVSSGYLSRPELTAAKFIRLPVPPPGADPATVWYRSGDLAMIDAVDLQVHCYGRTDDHGLQIKIRGFRVELGEIEAAMLNLSSIVGTGAVLLHKELDGVDQLVAYAVPAKQAV